MTATITYTDGLTLPTGLRMWLTRMDGLLWIAPWRGLRELLGLAIALCEQRALGNDMLQEVSAQP